MTETRSDWQEGMVVRAHGGHYYVRSGAETFDCTVRGRLKKSRGGSDLVAVGDRVLWSLSPEGQPIIEKVLPRHSALSRQPPPPRAPVEQIIVANVDQVLLVFSLRSPPLNPFMLDRYLVACEAANLPPLIVINKTDLGVDPDEEELLDMYTGIGYALQLSSVETGEGLEALRGRLRGKLSVLTGPSGVGKSSLLNALWPHLERVVGEISEVHDRGKHTTVVAEILNPEPDIFVADTPGMRQLRLWDVDPEQLEAFFPEMRPYLGQCRFTPCTHVHEPGCAVRAAAEREEIPPLRYESYLRMFELGF